MIQSANQWKFYQDKNGQWQWRKIVAKKVVAVSFDGFSSRRDCIWNAVQRGYLAPQKNYRYSKVPPVPGSGI